MNNLKNSLLSIILSTLCFSCDNSKYQECNEIMGVCSDSDDPYCLFGFDFAKSEKNSNLISISYSFQSAGQKVSTHSADSLLSLDFDQLIACSKEEIKRALDSYAGVTNLEFFQLEDGTDSDIKFFVADMGDKRGAVSFPNFKSFPCKEISGNVIINSKVNAHYCNSFYVFMLHEVGHALGLGHVSTDNIMNPATYKKHTSLQKGDTAGLIKLYGKKIINNNAVKL